MGVDWNQVAANNQAAEQERRDREAVEGITKANPNLDPKYAAWIAGSERYRAEQAQAKAEGAELESFIKHCNSEIDKPHNDPRNVEEWKRCLVEACSGKNPWHTSQMLQNDPVASLRFAKLRARLKGEQSPPGKINVVVSTKDAMAVWS